MIKLLARLLLLAMCLAACAPLNPAAAGAPTPRESPDGVAIPTVVEMPWQGVSTNAGQALAATQTPTLAVTPDTMTSNIAVETPLRPTEVQSESVSTNSEQEPAAAETPTPPVFADWKDLPVLPGLSGPALEIYRRGLAGGANPHAFAKAGDCETLTDWFLVDFERGPRYYNLGPYTSLQPVIDFYQGSLGRTSLAARRGFNAAALLTSFWSDQTVCQPDETPLGCEFRLTKPAFVLIMVGTNDVVRKASFEPTMRKVLDFAIAQNVLPVLVTKADNLEGDESINAAIGRLAQEYQLPLWNFWRAVQDLPGHGLVEDGAHLTHTPNRFDDPINLQSAWAVRNLNALQVLEIMMQAAE